MRSQVATSALAVGRLVSRPTFYFLAVLGGLTFAYALHSLLHPHTLPIYLGAYEMRSLIYAAIILTVISKAVWFIWDAAVNYVESQKQDKGYWHLPDVDVSVQEQDANNA